MKSEYPHSLTRRVKIITASEKRMSDVVYNSRAGALSDFRNCVPGAFVTFHAMKSKERKTTKTINDKSVKVKS